VACWKEDVFVPPGWVAALLADLASCGAGVAASQGRLEVPLPTSRPATDWERNVAGLAGARWATADMAYRRSVLAEVGGFDERFPRAYREDADLGLRVTAAGWSIVQGRRLAVHPVRPAPWSVSIRLQAGNADDALMARLHGRGWRARAGAPSGRRGGHLAVTAAAALGAAGLATGRRPLAAAGAAGWLAGTADFAWRRIAPGPRLRPEVSAMVATSAVVPLAATWHWMAGLVRARRLVPRRPEPACISRARARDMAPGSHGGQVGGPPALEAVLLDRDGTLVVDVPYNGDPERVEPVPGARAALDRLRAAGLRLAVVSNQSGVARGLVTPAQVDAVNERVQQLLGRFDAVVICPHGADDDCACRKPRPGMVLAAADQLGVEPTACAFVGDIGSDVDAALAAGARPVLVPTPVTRAEEIAAAPLVAASLPAAVDLLLGSAP
jgi:histidinol-phosphate phosphatase family protein